MHTCRLKAGFPKIFEIISSKSVGGVKYICVLKIKFDNLRRRLFYIHLHA